MVNTTLGPGMAMRMNAASPNPSTWSSVIIGRCYRSPGRMEAGEGEGLEQVGLAGLLVDSLAGVDLDDGLPGVVGGRDVFEQGLRRLRAAAGDEVLVAWRSTAV